MACSGPAWTRAGPGARGHRPGVWDPRGSRSGRAWAPLGPRARPPSAELPQVFVGARGCGRTRRTRGREEGTGTPLRSAAPGSLLARLLPWLRARGFQLGFPLWLLPALVPARRGFCAVASLGSGLLRPARRAGAGQAGERRGQTEWTSCWWCSPLEAAWASLFGPVLPQSRPQAAPPRAPPTPRPPLPGQAPQVAMRLASFTHPQGVLGRPRDAGGQ